MVDEYKKKIIENLPKNFDLIALYLTQLIVDLNQFDIKSNFDLILFGYCEYSDIGNTGYLGFKCFKHFEKNIKNDIKKRMSPKTIEKIKIIFDISQKYLILPMTKKIQEFGNQQKLLYQNEINRELFLDKLDKIENNKKGYIIAEIVERMERQGLIKFTNKNGNNRIGGRKYIKTTSNDQYKPPNFILPNGRSKLHENTIQALKKYFKKNFMKNIQIINEFKGPIFKKDHTRYDIAVYQDNKLLFLIEVDGLQHFKSVNKFGGEIGFEERQQSDKLKNKYILDNNLLLLRISYNDCSDKIITKNIDKAFRCEKKCHIMYSNDYDYVDMINNLSKK